MILDNMSVSESEASRHKPNVGARLNTDSSMSMSQSMRSSLLAGSPNLSRSILSGKIEKEPPKSKERFWVLLLFGCCTMINACGWISISPIFALVEAVSYLNPTPDVLT